MRPVNRSRVERAATWAAAWLSAIFPLAWLAMSVYGAFGGRISYWGWVLLTVIASVAGEGLRWAWRRIRPLWLRIRKQVNR